MDCGQIVRKTGRYFPDNLAIWCEGEELSYGQVFERACRLVNGLLALGVEPQDRVATLGPNALVSLEQIAGLALGGFVRLPLHYRNTADLHCYMMDRVGARVLIVDGAQYQELAAHLHEVPSLEHVIVYGGSGPIPYEELLAEASPEDPRVPVSPDDLIHLAFTSGTTGRPKGSVQTHRAWLGVTAEKMIILPPLTERDRYLAAGPLSHGAVTVLFAIIARGAACITMPSFEPALAAELIEQHRCTCTVMVPTTVQLLVNDPAARTRDLSSMRFIFCSGAPLTERTIRDTRALLGDVLYQGYGQSEGIPATVLTAEEIARGLDSDPSLLRSVGRPAPRSMVKIVDDDGNELPPGEVGEIAIDTPGNMKELWGDPEGTAERLTADGFILTRDIGHLDERGYLFLSDRKEDMIISGGFNIWPAEVENAVALHPAVLEVAVVGVPHPKWGETPRAVVVLKEGETATEEEIIQWCRERIGSMKKPTSVVFRAEPLPKSPVGKVVRRVVRAEHWPKDETGTMIGGA